MGVSQSLAVMLGVARALLGVLTLTTSLASVSGNLLLLLMLLREPRGGVARGVALSTSLSDLGLGLLAMPLLATPLLPQGGGFCQAAGFLLVLLLTGSAHTQCLAAAQRSAQLHLTLRYATVWTPCRRRAALLSAWLLSAVWAALPLAGVGSYAHCGPSPTQCGPSIGSGGCGWAVAWLLAGGATPVAVACLAAGRSVGVAWRQDRKGTFVCNSLHCQRVSSTCFVRSSISLLIGPGSEREQAGG